MIPLAEVTDRELLELQAETCKVLANAKRLELLYALKDGEKTVGDLVTILGVSKANVSQHLSLMRNKGIVKSRRDGIHIYYRVCNNKVNQACALMKEVLLELSIKPVR
ncbi:MAG: winged helix-turn-helix transcriptional regulator [Nitrospirae bacterium]|nr:winged helix-turn-helix transcriptional regulator [Nitrospirota bacterium]